MMGEQISAMIAIFPGRKLFCKKRLAFVSSLRSNRALAFAKGRFSAGIPVFVIDILSMRAFSLARQGLLIGGATSLRSLNSARGLSFTQVILLACGLFSTGAVFLARERVGTSSQVSM